MHERFQKREKFNEAVKGGGGQETPEREEKGSRSVETAR